MNDRDRDLIMAVAAGELGAPETAEAMSRINADPELAREYAAQRAALDALDSVEPVEMTGAERSELRSAVRSQLGLDAAPAVAAPAPRARRWLGPLFGLATAAAVVAAIVILPGTIGGDDDSAEVALMEETTTVLEAPASSDTEDTGGADADAGGAESLDEVAEAATTTAPSSAPLTDPGSVSDELLSITEGRQSPSDVENSIARSQVRGLEPYDATSTPGAAGCLEQLSEDRQDELIPLGTTGEGDAEILYVAVLAEEGIESVIAIDLTTCSVVDARP